MATLAQLGAAAGVDTEQMRHGLWVPKNAGTRGPM